ncbi:tyrosine-type recombinase/integrase [Deinococcus yunweiensis]|uniref:tyrosine-type recombinase/integrase n=1 Tax=Deinococcus yunweiensis TaxID=367282 RepID=UPI00398EB84D
MDIGQAIQEFLVDHTARGSRPFTVIYYRRTLHNLLQNWLTCDVQELNTFTVNRALAAMADRGVKPATLASADRALRGFTAWLKGVDLIPKDPMQGRKRPKLRPEPKRILSQEEIVAMFASVKSDKRHAARNTAILYLLLSTGLRAGELVSLTLSNIDWDTGLLTVSGKTGVGTVPVDRRTLQLLRRYITHSRKANIPQVFVYAGKPLSPDGLGQLIHRIAHRAGINRPIGPHILRHTFATSFIENGGDAFSLKRILRHTTMYTSLMYVHQSTTSIRQKMESATLFRDISI